MTSLELALVAGVPAAIAAPHVLPLDRVTPLWAAWLWLSGLALRALAAAGFAVFVLVYLPTTDLFRALAEWCWHDLLPVLAFDLGISGHPVAHAAVIAPVLALAASLLWLFGGLVRAWLTLRGRLARALGKGPRDSTVVDEARILVGVTRVGRGRIVISHAALWTLDAEELAACLAHEEAHIRRRHRPLLLAGSVLGALGRALPGTRSAERELAFQLERDADEYAVRETHDSLALASAICKAASDVPAPILVGLGGGGRLTRRLRYLVDDAPSRGGVFLEGSVRALTVLLATGAVCLALGVPIWVTAAGPIDTALSAVCPH
jgi:hypothetical protein